MIVAVLDGECVDSGTAFEIGYAYARNKTILGIKTDCRTFSTEEEINLMIEVAIELIRASDMDDLKENLLRGLS